MGDLVVVYDRKKAFANCAKELLLCQDKLQGNLSALKYPHGVPQWLVELTKHLLETGTIELHECFSFETAGVVDVLVEIYGAARMLAHCNDDYVETYMRLRIQHFWRPLRSVHIWHDPEGAIQGRLIWHDPEGAIRRRF